MLERYAGLRFQIMEVLEKSNAVSFSVMDVSFLLAIQRELVNLPYP